MAVVSTDYLNGVLTSFRALFASNFEAAQGLQGWNNLAIPMDSDGELNTYTWFGNVPKMEDVSHDVVTIRNLPDYNFSITNKEWQAAIEVERVAMERDKLNLVTPRIGQLALEAARHPGELIFSLFESNPTTFDGTAFFANSHTVATFDNLLAGSGVTVAQFQDDLGAASAAIALHQDDKGRAMNLVGNVIVVPPALWVTAWRALNANLATNGVDRGMPPASPNGMVNAGGYTIIRNPFLTDATDWYLLVDGGPTQKPFIYQVEKTPVVESDVNPNSREAIIQRTFLYSVYGRYNVGVTDPRFGAKIVNT